MSSDLSKHILATLAYYDVLDYPVTSFEIWKYLTQVRSSKLKVQSEKEKYSLCDIVKELESKNLEKFIEEYRGFYFLKGRKELVEKRIKRNKISEKKYKILLRVIKVLRFVPFVRMVAVTGRMAMKNAEEKSDLDLLVAVEDKKIFTGRILVTLAVHLMGKRRYRGKITDRICLNYFITTNSLEISTKDLFSSSEYYFALPVFGDKIFQEFRKKNSWIGEYKVNYKEDNWNSAKNLKDSWLTKAIRNTGEKILSVSWLEKKLRSWQLKRINRNPKTHQSGSMVMANDEALVFLPSPQGPKIYEKFQDKLRFLAL